MKYVFCLAALVLASSLAGCGSFTTIAPGPTVDKVYVTKTHVFLIFADSEVRVCNAAGTSVSECQQVKVE